MNPEIYQQDIQVKTEHIDNLNHVNNVIYLQWVQDAAYRHWIAKSSFTLRDQYHWVVLRHEIDYKSPAFMGEELVAKTWIQNYVGVKSTRIVQIYRKKDNRLLAEAKSLWCLILSGTGKPVRIGNDIKSVFVPEEQR